MSLESQGGPCVFSSIDEVVKDAAEGKVFILLDDENRENEGDLVVLADKVSAESVGMMIRHGSGIVCLAMTAQDARRLGLELMPRKNAGVLGTAFATSIDAKEGVTTGVSARDRTETIRRAISADSREGDFVTPGHVFPIVAHGGGVLERNGHTEASVAIAKLAGGTPAAVICELMNDDGTMSRLPDISAFARKYGLKVTTIKMLVEHLGRSS